MAILSEGICISIKAGLVAKDFDVEIVPGQSFYHSSTLYVYFMSMPGSNFRAIGDTDQAKIFTRADTVAFYRGWEIPELDNWLYSNMLYEEDSRIFATEASERTCTIDVGGEIIVGSAALLDDPVEAFGDALIQLFALPNFDDLRRV